MNKRQILFPALGAVIIFGLIIALSFQTRSLRDMRNELSTLQHENKMVSAQASSSATQSDAGNSDGTSSEQLLLTSQVDQQTNAIQTAPPETSKTGKWPYLTREERLHQFRVRPKDAWTFTDSGTPPDALESFVWSFNEEKVDELFSTLAPDAQSRFGGKDIQEVADWLTLDTPKSLKAIRVTDVFPGDFDNQVVATVHLHTQNRVYSVRIRLTYSDRTWKVNYP